MKGTTRSFRVIVWASLAVAFILVTGAQAGAGTWYTTHGNNTAVEDEKDPSIVESCVRKGTGLDVKLWPGTATWVHFAVPTPSGTERGFIPGKRARVVNVRVNLLNSFCLCSGISEIRVYNGETLVKTFVGRWYTTGWQNIRLDLGRLTSFGKGLGISVRIDTGPNGGHDSYTFSGAGAYFEP